MESMEAVLAEGTEVPVKIEGEVVAGNGKPMRRDDWKHHWGIKCSTCAGVSKD
jgi:hypothetical protein